MEASIFVIEAGLFAFCLFVHIFLWRRNLPRNQGPTLLAIFGVPWTIITVVFLFFLKTGRVSEYVCSLALLHLSLSSAYIFTYPALEGLSPSLIILIFIEKTKAGLTAEEVIRRFDATLLWDKKIESLLNSGLVTETEGKLRITSKGKLFIMPFIVLRRFLGLPMGEG